MKRWFIIVMIAFSVSACFSTPIQDLDVARTSLNTQRYLATLERCTDGDTARFLVEGESISVRFLSIDTPELARDGLAAQPYAQEAANLACTHLQKADEILLELDPYQDSQDRYGRWLAYVWVDEVLLQEILIEAGLADLRYAHEVSLYDDQLHRILKLIQARRLGRWK